MKKSAVEFLKFRYENNITLNLGDFEQAKEMEKYQIENTFEAGFVTQQWDKTKENKAEEYYNETFNK